MLKKTILGVATAAAFGAVALVPTAASAHWHHHHHHGWWGLYAGPAYYYPAYSGYSGYEPGCYVRKRWVWTPGGWVLARRPICY